MRQPLLIFNTKSAFPFVALLESSKAAVLMTWAYKTNPWLSIN
ncbi:hypothetical protein Z949_148 [Sulfitobacter guttiformis KCTC 32187]|nr:hypothetical protein Z949_148 [Sulfitobacter guttiformis KCTC 32187]